MLVLRGHRGPVVGLAYSPDGQTLASASADGTARLWDLHDGRLQETFNSSEARAYCVAYSPDGSMVAIGYGGDHGLVALWNLHPLRKLESWSAHSRVTRGVTFTENCNFLVTGGQNPSLRVWNLPGIERVTVSTETGPTLAVAAVKGSTSKFVSLADYPSRALLWEQVGLKTYLRARLEVPFTVATGAYSMAVSNSGTFLGCGLERRIFLGVPKRRSAKPVVYAAHDGAVLGIAFLPDGQSLLSAATDGLVKHWSLTGESIRTIDWQIGELGAVAIAPDGLTAAVGGAEDIVVWDLEA